MGAFQEYDQYDGLGLAELVKKKEISPAEICEEAIDRIGKVNPQLNAVVTPMFDVARQISIAVRESTVLLGSHDHLENKPPHLSTDVR